MPSLKTKANLDNLETFLDFILDQAVACIKDKKKLNQIRLACEEIIINVTNYAYPENEGPIEIQCECSQKDGIFTIVIIDWGTSFNPLEAKAPDINKEANERQIGGLGIYLTLKVMDKVDYKREGSKNMLTLVKKI